MGNAELVAKIAQTQPNPTTDLPQAIQRYLNGESMQVLAKELGVARQTLYKWMLSDVGPAEWKDLKRDAIINRIADADEEMETAATTEDIARAREKMRFSRMDFERRFPKLYGPKQELEVDNKLTIIVARTPQHIETDPQTLDVNSQVIDNIEEQGCGPK